MKALTLTQPWASLVAAGLKRIETRSWGTMHRGPLAIHAAKGIPGWVRELMDPDLGPESEIFQASQAAGLPQRVQDMPRGMVIATVRLVDVVPTSRIKKYLVDAGWEYDDWTCERPLGDYTPGRFAWVLADVAVLPEPIPARGALGLWDWQPPRELEGAA